MSRTIVKPNRDVDYYVEWSSIVDAPIFYGDRAHMMAEGIEKNRLDYADEHSASARWYLPSWEDDEEYDFHSNGSFPRSRMPEVVTAFFASGEDYHSPAVLALLDPYEE